MSVSHELNAFVGGAKSDSEKNALVKDFFASKVYSKKVQALFDD